MDKSAKDFEPTDIEITEEQLVGKSVYVYWARYLAWNAGVVTQQTGDKWTVEFDTMGTHVYSFRENSSIQWRAGALSVPLVCSVSSCASMYPPCAQTACLYSRRVCMCIQCLLGCSVTPYIGWQSGFLILSDGRGSRRSVALKGRTSWRCQSTLQSSPKLGRCTNKMCMGSCKHTSGSAAPALTTRQRTLLSCVGLQDTSSKVTLSGSHRPTFQLSSGWQTSCLNLALQSILKVGIRSYTQTKLPSHFNLFVF